MELKKPVKIKGVVRPGHGRGEKLGAPTANLDLSLAKNMTKGLYECTVEAIGSVYQGLLYYGINSLTGSDCLEVHLLNFNGDLVGKEVVVTVGRYVREPRKFVSEEKLRAQIKQDIFNSL